MKTSKRILLTAVAAMLVVFSAGCSFSFSTATITEAIMTDSIDQDGIPGETVYSYPANAPMLYTSAKLLNAPDNTQIRIVWAYVTGKQVMDEVILDSGTLSDRYIFSYFEPTELLPEGDYRVDYFIDDNKDPAARVEFTVTAAEYDVPEEDDTTLSITPFIDSTIFSTVHMTSYIDVYAPVDTIEVVPTTGIWYVSAILKNPYPDSVFYFVWYDTEGTVMDIVDVDLEGTSDTYLYSSFTLSGTAPEGQYYIGVFVDDAEEPSALIVFTAMDGV